MLKPIVFLLAFLPSVFGHEAMTTTTDCGCASVSNVASTKTSSSISFEWTGATNSTQYEVWYYNKDTNTTSAVFTTTANVMTLSNLASGTYDFFIKAKCGSEGSNIVGLEDILIG